MHRMPDHAGDDASSSPIPSSGADATQGAAGLIIFSHANSFPAGTYRQHFAAWQAAGYEVCAIEKYGHDPRYPVTDSWTEMERQLVDFLDEQIPRAAGRPVYLVGHSMGGYLSLMAALRRPQAVSGVVLLDAPVLSGWKAWGVRLAKALKLVGKVTPAKVSATRRNHWPDTRHAVEHFSAKPMFQRWEPGVLADYVAAGIEPVHTETLARHGNTLAFKREVETAIYSTLPHGLMARVRRNPPRFPVAFIAGTKSHELRQVGLSATRQLAGERISWIKGSHLFPFEQPAQTVQEVLKWLGAFAGVPSRVGGAHPTRP